jgi:hypothetical protein
MVLFTEIFEKAKQAIHVHKWEYERHNAVMIRSCICMTTEQGIIDEDPELVSSSPMRNRDFNKIVWERV